MCVSIYIYTHVYIYRDIVSVGDLHVFHGCRLDRMASRASRSSFATAGAPDVGLASQQAQRLRTALLQCGTQSTNLCVFGGGQHHPDRSISCGFLR